MEEMKRSVLTCGDFGRSMAAVLPGWKPVDLDAAADGASLKQRLAATVSGSSFVLFASWRERQDVTRLLDRLCHEAAKPWIPIVVEHPWVRVGPGIAPGQTPCHKCFALRRLQHDPSPDLSLALEAAYANNSQKGVRGYLPHHLRIAAGLTAWVEDRLRPNDDQRSPILRYHMLRNEIELNYVVGVHGCDRCDAKRHARTNDSILACFTPLVEHAAAPVAADAGAPRE